MPNDPHEGHSVSGADFGERLGRPRPPRRSGHPRVSGRRRRAASPPPAGRAGRRVPPTPVMTKRRRRSSNSSTTLSAGSPAQAPAGRISPPAACLGSPSWSRPERTRLKNSASRPVSRVLYGRDIRPGATAIPLGRPSPGALNNQPERQGLRTGPAGKPARRSYSVSLPARLPCRRRCRRRGALLPHPFTLAPASLWPHRGGLLSVALSLGSPRRTLSGAASVWSPDFPPLPKRRPSGRLARWAYEREAPTVKGNHEVAALSRYSPGGRAWPWRRIRPSPRNAWSPPCDTSSAARA